jgi:uncharacterized protein (DUF4415 family)
MAQKQLKGVGGVLGGLLSPAPPPATPDSASRPAPEAPADEAADAEAVERPAPPAEIGKPRQNAPTRTQARRGRPPGRRAGEAADKEKVTLRLGKELMDEYREWSWEERCQLGELVERALSQYRKQRSRQKSQ